LKIFKGQENKTAVSAVRSFGFEVLEVNRKSSGLQTRIKD